MVNITLNNNVSLYAKYCGLKYDNQEEDYIFLVIEEDLDQNLIYYLELLTKDNLSIVNFKFDNNEKYKDRTMRNLKLDMLKRILKDSNDIYIQLSSENLEQIRM